MGKKAKTSRKGKKAWRANIPTDDIEEYFEKATTDALSGGPLSSVPSDSLFYIDKSSKDIPVKRKIEKHREKILHCDSILQRNSFVHPVPSSAQRKSKERKEILTAELQAHEALTVMKNGVSGLTDIWNENDEGNQKAKKKPVVSLIPAVEVEPPGCSFNPPFEAHQDALAQAVAVEMQKVYRDELGPQPVPITVDGEVVEEEEKYFLDADDGSDDVDDEFDSSGDVNLVQRPMKTKRITRVELNQRARRKVEMKAEAEAKKRENVSKEIDCLQDIMEEIANEDEEKDKRHVRRVIAKRERLKSGPPRLGKHKSMVGVDEDSQQEGDVNVLEDPGWAHCTVVDLKKRRVKCNYCGKQMNGGVFRLKQHLAGVRGNVTACEMCPKEIMDEMRKLLTGKRQIKQMRVEQEVELLDEIASRGRLRTLVGGVSMHERSDPTYALVDSDDEDEEEVDPQFAAARKESLRSFQQDEDRRRGIETSLSACSTPATELLTPTSSPEPSLHRSTSRVVAMMGCGGKRQDVYDSQRVGPMDHYLYRKCSKSQPTIKQALRGVKKSFDATSHAFKNIVKWFVHAGVPVHAVSSPYFQIMIDAVVESGVGLKAPTWTDIYGAGLDGEYVEIQQWVESFKPVWRERGCTLICDGWTSVTKKSMINFVVYCTEGMIFLKSVDASNNTKNINYLFNLMDEMVEQIGEENVVQVVTDNEPSYEAATRKLMEKRKHLYWVPCAAHSLDLMLEDIGKDMFVHQLVQQAQKITQFIYSHNRILNMIRINATGGRDIICVGSTRFASNFASLELMLRYKHELITFFKSNEYLSYIGTFDRDDICDARDINELINSYKFWEKLSYYLKLVEPLIQVLRMIDGDDKNEMGFLCKAMDLVKERMKKIDLKAYKKWWAIIDTRWESTLHHDLHAAGYYLNPRFQYSNSIHNDGEVIQGTVNVIRRLLRTIDDKIEAERQMEHYRLRIGIYADEGLQAAVTRVSPAEWWIMVNNRNSFQNPLAYVAVRVLSQTTGTSQCERNQNTCSLIHSKVCNQLKSERSEKLVFCHFNMRLRLENIKLRQKLQDKRALQRPRQLYTIEEADATKQIDMEEIFEGDHPLRSWVETRAEFDEPLIDPKSGEWAEDILDRDQVRDPELRTSKRPIEVSTQPPHEHVKNSDEISMLVDSQPLTRSISSVERTATIGRSDLAIGNLQKIYSRACSKPRGKSIMSQLQEHNCRQEAIHGSQSSSKRKLIVDYDDDDDDDDDDET